jgi:short-subunit dehydrogenase
MRISGKRVIVTGASSGIGRALAVSLAGRGAVLTIAARRRDRLEGIAHDIAAQFPDIPPPVAVPCDVTSAADVSTLIGGTVERLGSVDILINNAGVSVYGEMRLTRAKDFCRVMSVNFFGAVQCMLEVLPFMRRQDSGLIVNIASVAGLHGIPFLGAYSASKAALISTSQSLRAELAESGVNVMIVYPGYTDTEIFEREVMVGGGRRPSAQYAPVDEVAEAIVRAIERGGRDLIMTSRGKLLSILRGAAPAVVERAMRRMARELSDPDEPRRDPEES